MPPYTYESFSNRPYVGTIADLMQEPGRAQARAAEIGGQAKAQALMQMGQGIGGAVQYAFDPHRKLEDARLQMEQAQLAEMQRQAKGRQILGAAIKQFSSIDPNSGALKVDHKAIATVLGQAGYPEQAESWLKTATGNEENLAKLDEMRRGYQQHVMATLGDLAFESKTPQDFVSSVGLAAAHQLIDEQTAHQIATAVGTPQADSIRQSYLRFSPKYQAQQAELQKPTKLGPGENIVIPASGQVVASGGPAKQDEWQAFQTAYAQKAGKKSWAELAPDEQMKGFTAFSTAKQTPESKEMAKLRETLLSIQIGQQPTKDDAQLFAKQLLAHQLAPSQIALFGGFGAAGAAFKRMVGAEALKLDPSFNWEEAESTYNLAKSPSFQNTVRYMDSVTESLPRLLDTAKALANGNVRGINALINAGKNQFNNVDLRKFKTDIVLVGDEVAKILQGGGSGSATSDAKLKQAQDIFSTSDDPAVIAGAMGEVQALIGNRRRALTRGTYMETQGAGDARTRARDILAKAGKVSDGAAVDLFLKNNPTFK